MKVFLRHTLILLLYSNHFISSSQDLQENTIPLQIFDEVVRVENTGLANGEEYIEKHVIRNDEHKYFLSSQFLNADIIYDDQLYASVPIKYNIYDDLLLVSLKTTVGTSTIKLHNEKVASFKIEDHYFINITAENEDNLSGFHEVLLDQEEIILLKKHYKKIHKELDRNFTYYRFEVEKPQYAIFSKETFFRIDTRRDVQKIFPDREKDIRSFYKSNSSLRKNQPDQFMTSLLQYILN